MLDKKDRGINVRKTWEQTTGWPNMGQSMVHFGISGMGIVGETGGEVNKSQFMKIFERMPGNLDVILGTIGLH